MTERGERIWTELHRKHCRNDAAALDELCESFAALESERDALKAKIDQLTAWITKLECERDTIVKLRGDWKTVAGLGKKAPRQSVRTTEAQEG